MINPLRYLLDKIPIPDHFCNSSRIKIDSWWEDYTVDKGAKIEERKKHIEKWKCEVCGNEWTTNSNTGIGGGMPLNRTKDRFVDSYWKEEMDE